MEVIITKEEIKKLIFERDLLDAKIEAFSKMLRHGHSEWVSDSNDNQEVRYLQANIERYKADRNRINDILNNKIIYDETAKKTEDVVGINDILQIELIDEDGEREISVIQLVGVKVDLSGDIYKISVSSPIGKAIYGQKYGSTVTYNVNGLNYTLNIVQKIDENTLGNDDISKGSR